MVMIMKNLTIIVLGKNFNISHENIDVLYADNNNLLEKINSVNTKYISFIKDDDEISSNYLDLLLKKCTEEFDCCFINYRINYEYVNEPKININEKELIINKPYYGEYIWSFIFNKDKLIEILNCNKDNFNKNVDNIFKNISVIGDVIYYHNPNGIKYINNFCYNDIKSMKYFKNIIYVANGCNGIFNGYVSWIKNIGFCFSNKYDITILYDEMCAQTYNAFSKMFKCVKLSNDTNYVCNRLLVTYSSYYYPKNIFHLEENYLFIHGNMSDYSNARKFTDDLYSKYIAVSKTAKEKAIGYFPTDNIEYILNPFKLNYNLVKPHLKLVSAQRNSAEKRPERFIIIARILNELKIPFTWNVFTDATPSVYENGLIYRYCVENPFPYIQDSDYFVLLSDTESLSYSMVEALCLHTKVIATPLEAYNEIGIKDGENGYIIPFEYFDEKNKDKLVELIKKIYLNKYKSFNYKFNEKLYDGYNKLFTK